MDWEKPCCWHLQWASTSRPNGDNEGKKGIKNDRPVRRRLGLGFIHPWSLTTRWDAESGYTYFHFHCLSLRWKNHTNAIRLAVLI